MVFGVRRLSLSAFSGADSRLQLASHGFRRDWWGRHVQPGGPLFDVKAAGGGPFCTEQPVVDIKAPPDTSQWRGCIRRMPLTSWTQGSSVTLLESQDGSHDCQACHDLFPRPGRRATSWLAGYAMVCLGLACQSQEQNIGTFELDVEVGCEGVQRMAPFSWLTTNLHRALGRYRFEFTEGQFHEGQYEFVYFDQSSQLVLYPEEASADHFG